MKARCALTCWIRGHNWTLQRPVNAKIHNYWHCSRCGRKVDA